ncbi:TonB-dependent receptor domain-containing protein [Sphingomonas sp. MMS24-J13]|uniref:TonB-dependent receptor domain-containing protein n=1 Tax=Sphingomonas sp. MMS24-J13 TaxID=3238686 RepID=UPI00384E209B
MSLTVKVTLRQGVAQLALGAALVMLAAPTSAQNAAQPAATPDAADAAEIVVTGSRLATGFSSPTPVAVVGAARLEQRGITNVADALNEVPSFRASNTPASGELAPTAGYIGGRILDLRGLGAVRTLTQVDSMRFVPSTTQATVDTNMIPSILLSQAEVVTGGASAQYGSDAVAGVVNLRLNHKLNGFKFSGTSSITRYGDNSDPVIGLAWGGKLSDTVHVVIGGEYEHDAGVGDCQSRAFCRTNTLNFGRNPGVTNMPANNILSGITPSTVPFNGVTTPPASAYTGKNFPTLRPIDGITFSPDGTPRRFQYGTISNNLYMQGGEGQSDNIYFKDLYIVAPTERYAITGMLDWDVTPSIKASAMVNYGHLRAEYTAQYYRNTAITIRSDNPFIPRSADPTLDIPTLLAQSGLTSFTLGKGFPEIGRTGLVTNDDVIRGVAKLSGALGGSWSWDAYYQYGHNKFREDVNHAIVASKITNALDATSVNGVAICRINADANPNNDDAACVPYDPFGQKAAKNAASIAYFTTNAFQTAVTNEHVVAANLKGNLFNLPAGPVAIAVGGEFRSDKIAGDTDANSKRLALYSANGSIISGQIQVAEGYVEGEVPILKDVPFFDELSANGAVRRTHYKRSGTGNDSSVNVTTWKVGGVWEPIPAIRFRATKSRDIRAPNISELFGPTTLSSGIVSDPVKGQTVVNIHSGSNPNLKPEQANTFTAGVVLKPQGGILGRFRGSVDWYDINIKDAISTLGQQNILTRCFQGDAVSCSLIVRDSNGFATDVTDVLQNVNRLITRGIDFEVDYRQPLQQYGSLDFRILANYVKDFITVDAVGSTNRAGQTGLRGGTPPGLPDWQVDGLVAWNYQRLTLSTHIKWINKGFYNAAFVGPDQAGYNITLTNSSSTNSVPSRTYVDLMAQYRLPFGSSHDMTTFIGVDNVFNTTPPLNPGSHGTGNDILFSPLGTTFKFGVRINY